MESFFGFLMSWTVAALIHEVIWLFVWKYFHKKDPCTFNTDLLWQVGGLWCIVGMALWPFTIPVEVLAGIEYLLYLWIIKK